MSELRSPAGGPSTDSDRGAAAGWSDAERAVRAALDRVDAVTLLSDGTDGTTLQARAGFVTGEAAVRLAAVGQGMVTGDVVNTAARVQAVAEPGAVPWSTT